MKRHGTRSFAWTAVAAEEEVPQPAEAHDAQRLAEEWFHVEHRHGRRSDAYRVARARYEAALAAELEERKTKDGLV